MRRRWSPRAGSSRRMQRSEGGETPAPRCRTSERNKRTNSCLEHWMLHSDPPKMENLPGAASHGRKLRNSKGRALEASTVQYCDKWGYILIQVGATSWDSCTKLLFNIEGYNFLLRGISLRSTIRKLELHGFLWSGCPLLNFISKKSKIKKLYGS